MAKFLYLPSIRFPPLATHAKSRRAKKFTDRTLGSLPVDCREIYFLHKGGALANITIPLVSLFFQNTKPDWHETGRAQREINHRCCLTRIGEANQAVFISTAGGA